MSDYSGDKARYHRARKRRRIRRANMRKLRETLTKALAAPVAPAQA